MTSTIETPAVGTEQFAHQLAWDMEFELRPSTRPFGPEDKQVAVREIVAGDFVYGFLVLLGYKPVDSYLAVAEEPGSPVWHEVCSHVPEDDDALDKAARDVIANCLYRSELARQDV